MLAEDMPKGAAAIANKLCAKLYNLEIVKENIEDLDKNMTRFFVLSKEGNGNEGDKNSIIFSTTHKAGTLFRVLEVFAKQDINLTRIESIPSDPGDYAFFLDFIGSDKEEKVQKALTQAKEVAANFKVLGCYKERIVE
jgi:prephenate dehydratase